MAAGLKAVLLELGPTDLAPFSGRGSSRLRLHERRRDGVNSSGRVGVGLARGQHKFRLGEGIERYKVSVAILSHDGDFANFAADSEAYQAQATACQTGRFLGNDIGIQLTAHLPGQALQVDFHVPEHSR